jgi:hypothetical protein
VIKGKEGDRKQIMTVYTPRHYHGVCLVRLKGTITKEAVRHLPRFEGDSSQIY